MPPASASPLLSAMRVQPSLVFILHPSTVLTQNCCLQCRCSRCRKVSYCNRNCQKANWKKHKPQCKEAVAARAREQSTQSYPLNGYRNGVPGRAISRRPNCASVRSPHTPCCPRVVLALYWAHTGAVGSHHVPFKFPATELRSALCTSSWDAVSSFDPRRSSHVGAPVRSAVIGVARY